MNNYLTLQTLLSLIVLLLFLVGMIGLIKRNDFPFWKVQLDRPLPWEMIWTSFV